MENINFNKTVKEFDDTCVIRRFKIGDETEIANVINRTFMEVNIRDYSKENLESLVKKFTPDFIIKRATAFHMYVATDENKIIGVGAVGPYWDSLTESSLFNIFVLPEYEGKGIGTKIIKALEDDEYYKRADRVEIASSITAVDFYRHLGYGFKKNGNIADNEGHYILEKFPKINYNNNDITQYNLRPYINNEYHNYYDFVYQVKKDAYKKYVEECWGSWVEDDQQEYFKKFINQVKDDVYIIQLNGKDIGFYNGETLENGSYEIGNICIIPEYQGMGIGTRILKDITELHKEQDLHIQYFKQNPVGNLYEKLGFISNGETEFHYQMIKPVVKHIKK